MTIVAAVANRARTALAVIGLVAIAAACVNHPVGPARTWESYAAKASTTVESTISAVETVLLLAETASDGDLIGPYASVAISEQEDSLGGVRGTFMSIQPPPGDRTADLRAELAGLLDAAFAHVGDVRIEARRGNLDGLDHVAAPLRDDADALRDLQDRLP
jgi:ABC-type glycerol-3-phosphate transport system substrate-binding protein